MASDIWVSMTTTDLERATAFYTGLGYELNPRFSDTNAACFEIGDGTYFMLVMREFFATMTDKTISDPKTSAQIGINLTRDSRADVDAIIERGLASGGTEPRPAQDYGFMYSRDLEDPDGNNLGFLYMSPETLENGPDAASVDHSAAPA